MEGFLAVHGHLSFQQAARYQDREMASCKQARRMCDSFRGIGLPTGIRLSLISRGNSSTQVEIMEDTGEHFHKGYTIL